jgi:AraC-like DNA-binding protein
MFSAPLASALTNFPEAVQYNPHCGRQFVNNPSRQPISQDKRDLIDKLLKERLALAAIARVAEVSERWLQDYVNQKYYLTPKEAKITEKKRGKLILEIDELWSFVGSKRNKVWILLAIDSLTCISCGCLRSAIAIAPPPENYGILYHQFTVNVQLVIQIFGKPIKEFYRLRDIKQLAKKLVRLII